jgi:hypothetical protein
MRRAISILGDEIAPARHINSMTDVLSAASIEKAQGEVNRINPPRWALHFCDQYLRDDCAGTDVDQTQQVSHRTARKFSGIASDGARV